MVNSDISLDVSKNGTQATVYVNQYDNNTRSLTITLNNDGKKMAIPEDCYAMGFAVIDGITYSNEAKIENDKILFTFPSSYFDKSGKYELQIRLQRTVGEKAYVLFSPKLQFVVSKSLYDSDSVTGTTTYDQFTYDILRLQSSQIVSITEKRQDKEHIYTVTFKSGKTQSFTVSDGVDGLTELEATTTTRFVYNLGNHLYYTTSEVKLRTNATLTDEYLVLPQGTLLLVKKKTTAFGDILSMYITVIGSCTLKDTEYKYGIHEYTYNSIGGFISNSFVIDTQSIETAISELQTVTNTLETNVANKQDKLTAGAGIAITDEGVISNTGEFHIVVLADGEDLPWENPQKNTIYFKRNSDTGSLSEDWYYEYIWADDWFELIGTTQIDLSDYAKKTDLPTATSQLTNDSNYISDENYTHTDNNYTTAEKDKLSGLSNYDDTAVKALIAAKQDSLTATQLSNISAVPNKQDKLTSAQLANIEAVANKQDKLTAGANIKIENNVISLDIETATAATLYGGDTQ